VSPQRLCNHAAIAVRGSIKFCKRDGIEIANETFGVAAGAAASRARQGLQRRRAAAYGAASGGQTGGTAAASGHN
jgi:hypothetical protein